MEKGEIVVYQSDEVTKLEVRVNDDTVWLTQEQMATIFDVGRPAITKHIKNIYRCGELNEQSTCSILEHMGNDGKQSYSVRYFNLDMILSVGYRVNSKNAIAFRRWASNILKEYLLKGYAVSQQFKALEDRIDRRLIQYDKRLDEQERKIEFFIQSSLPPVQGVFFDGQVYDAYVFVAGLVRKAVRRIVLIDNYIDDTVLTILDKRGARVKAVIYTGKVSKQLQLDIDKHNAQYPQIDIKTLPKRMTDF